MSKTKILVVEDESIVAKDIKNILENLGYTISAIAYTGEEAVAKVKETHPDLILMDIVLEGDMDGIETANYINTHFDIPIVYLTAYTEDKTLERAKITGPFGYILKPFEEKELYFTIEMALYKYKFNKKLRDSEEKYRTLVEQSMEGIFLAFNFKFVYTNSTLLKTLGVKTFSELKNKNFLEFIESKTAKKIQKDIQRTLKDKISEYRYDVRAKRIDGKDIFLELSLTRVMYEGKPHTRGIVTDITERKRAEEKIEQKRAEKLRNSINRISRAALSTTDMGELYKVIHKIICELMPAENFYIALYDDNDMLSFPYYVDEYDLQPPIKKMGKGLTEYVFKTEKPLLASPNVYNRLAKEGKIDLIGKHSFCWLGVPLKTKDRTIGVLAVQSYTKDIIYGDEDKNILTFVSTQIAMAIEQKKADKALQESREKFQRLFMNNPEASVYINPDGKILNVNPRFCELFGYSVDELKGKYINDMIVQKKRMKEAELLDKKSVTGCVSHDTFRQKKNGSLVPVSISAAPITIEGDLIGVMVLYKDITQQKQAEELLQKTKEELETRVEERTSKLSKAIDQLMKEFTERKKAEKEKERMHTQLLQVQKMEAIGTLAGGVAHDFNNLLTAIQGYTDLMLMKVEEKNPLHKYLKNIHRASIRAAGLTRQLLLFSRKQPMKLSLININQTVNGLVNMLSRVITETIDIKTKQDSNIWNIKADVANIEQVIMNLALNARDAMPKGGKLMIKTENVKINIKQSKNIPESRVGKFVCLSVSDTGLGIDKDIIDHIFVPFFSTKESGKGTGLGLSVAYGIIKQHDGWINVYSKSGKGSTFKVYLPAFPDETLKKARVKIPLIELHGKGKRILLIEDNNIVREFAVGGLREHGYTIFEAADAKKALEIFKREQGNFQLIFSDVVLPDINGIELVEQIQSSNPKIPALLCSGYTEQLSQLSKIRESNFRFINKPYALSELLKIIKELIESSQ